MTILTTVYVPTTMEASPAIASLGTSSAMTHTHMCAQVRSHMYVLVIVCFMFVLFGWCIGSEFSFFSLFMTNLASVLYTCIFMYLTTCCIRTYLKI